MSTRELKLTLGLSDELKSALGEILNRLSGGGAPEGGVDLGPSEDGTEEGQRPAKEPSPPREVVSLAYRMPLGGTDLRTVDDLRGFLAHANGSLRIESHLGAVFVVERNFLLRLIEAAVAEEREQEDNE